MAGTVPAALRFRHGHATHRDWRMATELCLAQVEGQARQPGHERRATLGLVYCTEALAAQFDAILDLLKLRTGVFEWAGTSGLGIAAGAGEYFEEPALAIMLCQFPEGAARVFSGVLRPPGRAERTPAGGYAAETALIHADPLTPDLGDLLEDMAGKLRSGRLFGGLSSGAGRTVQVANRTLSGGLSGVVFGSEVALASRVAQGCQPLGPAHVVTRGQDNLIATLDGQAALDVLLRDCQVDLEAGAAAADGAARRAALVRVVRGTLCGLLPAPLAGTPDHWEEAEVRPLIGVDPQQRVLAIGDHVAVGARLRFCSRDRNAARLDLVRACSDLREECEQRAGGLAAIRGALYVSCIGRGSALFGRGSGELDIIREQLGEIPLVGFFANGEIAGKRLYGYTGVLTLFL